MPPVFDLATRAPAAAKRLAVVAGLAAALSLAGGLATAWGGGDTTHTVTVRSNYISEVTAQAFNVFDGAKTYASQQAKLAPGGSVQLKCDKKDVAECWVRILYILDGAHNRYDSGRVASCVLIQYYRDPRDLYSQYC